MLVVSTLRKSGYTGNGVEGLPNQRLSGLLLHLQNSVNLAADPSILCRVICFALCYSLSLEITEKALAPCRERFALAPAKLDNRLEGCFRYQEQEVLVAPADEGCS